MDENNQMLQQALEQFNRKERYWLLREALGGGSSQKLSSNFLGKLASALGIGTIDDSNAWWAMDYHIDWLVGALSLFDASKKKVEQEEPK